MQRPTAIVFDCFGVLYQDAFKQFLDDYNSKLPETREYYYELTKQNEFGYVSDEDYYDELSKGSGVPADEIKRRFNDTDCLNVNVVGIVEELHKAGQYKIGMLSNVERGFLQKFLENHNIGHLFGYVLASSETAHVKPEREIFEVLSERMDVPFEQWFFVDDSSANVEAAKSYGIPSHLFTTTDELRAALQSAGVV